MRSTTVLITSLGILLASCSLPARPAQPAPGVSSASSAVSSSSLPRLEEIEESGERAPTTEERTETGAIMERLLPNGVLELGNPDAPLTLLVFTEHHCSYCRQFLTELFPRLKTDFLDKGQLKLQIAMLTLEKYPASTDAARGFLCAAMQGKGYAMHSTLFANVNKARDAQRSYAEALGIDLKKFNECLLNPATDALLAVQKSWAQSLSVSVVPVFFLNGEKMVGLPYYPDLRGKIEAAMKEAQQQ